MLSIRKVIFVLATVLTVQAGPAFSQPLKWMPPQILSTKPDQRWLGWNYKMDASPNGTILCTWTKSDERSEYVRVFSSRSVDMGVTWSESNSIESNSSAYAMVISHPILYLGNSTWCALIERDFSWPGSAQTQLHVSTDDGLTWNPSFTPVNTYSSLGTSNQNGIMMGIKNDYPDLIIYKSMDAGNTFERKRVLPSDFRSSKIFHIEGQSWVVIHGSNEILITHDDGETWESAVPNAPLDLFAMHDIRSDHKGTLMASLCGTCTGTRYQFCGLVNEVN